MARCECQNIPGDLLEDYVAVLEPASEFNLTGKKGKIMPERVRKRFPFQLEPPHVATPAQLEVREWFKDGIACFNETTQSERNAWYMASLGSGLFYYDYYLSQIIPRLKAGETCEDTKNPNARVFKSFDGHQCGQVDRFFISAENRMLWCDIESNIVEYEGCFPEPWHGVIHILHHHRVWDPPEWVWYLISDFMILWPERKRVAENYLLYGTPDNLQRVRVQVDGLVGNVCVVWAMDIDIPWEYEELYNFE